MSKSKAAGVLRLVFHDAGTFEMDDNSGNSLQVILMEKNADVMMIFFMLKLLKLEWPAFYILYLFEVKTIVLLILMDGPIFYLF